MQPGPVGVRRDERRIEPNSLVEIGHGAIEVAPGAMREAAAVVGPREARIEADRLVEVRQRSLVVALVAVDDAAFPMGCGIVRLQVDGGVEIGERPPCSPRLP
jgi:hypothetical protein